MAETAADVVRSDLPAGAQEFSAPPAISPAAPWLLGAILGDGDGGFVEVFALTRRNGREAECGSAWFASPADALAYAVDQARHRDAYVGMTVRGEASGTASACIRASVLWADLDAGWELLDRFPLAPSMVLASGTPGRFQAFWRLAEPVDLTDAADRAEFRRVLQGVQRAVGADTGANLDRRMRIPGCPNWKTGRPVAVSVTDRNELAYSLDDFEPYLLAPLEAEPAPPAAENRAERRHPRRRHTGGSEARRARPVTPAPAAIDLAGIRLSPKVRQLIAEGWEAGRTYGVGRNARRFDTRSEADQAAVCGLLAARCSDAVIRAVFEREAIGAKFREPGAGWPYLSRTINAGETYLAARGLGYCAHAARVAAGLAEAAETAGVA